jgi:hypothetical protein
MNFVLTVVCSFGPWRVVFLSNPLCYGSIRFIFLTVHVCMLGGAIAIVELVLLRYFEGKAKGPFR